MSSEHDAVCRGRVGHHHHLAIPAGIPLQRFAHSLIDKSQLEKRKKIGAQAGQTHVTRIKRGQCVVGQYGMQVRGGGQENAWRRNDLADGGSKCDSSTRKTARDVVKEERTRKM